MTYRSHTFLLAEPQEWTCVVGGVENGEAQ
jgi:hypothetical protein